ncbi:metallophosphoesterase [Sediminicola luteus]|uniref:Phosphoesterase n=1 Tax=Sediminicola luteus TaxID=319238 RepID=A0A2A4G5H4_9FLAO|nr:metallophosphoesterase [Sediminicola luteus]PCE63214.1 phosphoesterase [Sediminicola luteus]
MWIRLLILFALLAFLTFYVFQGFKNLGKGLWLGYIYVALSVLVFAWVIYLFNVDGTSDLAKSYSLGLTLTLLVFGLVALPFLFLEDIGRVGVGLYQKFWSESKSFQLPGRRKFISQLALGLAAIPFGAMLYGMVRGKYNFKVLKYDLAFDDLPDAFDGYQITQISDIHSGSFDNREKIAYAIDLINQQKSDVLFFTGDMVNNKADEMEPWKDLFAKLDAPDGKFSVLGNHDYGDYVRWESKEEKAANLDRLKQLQQEMGFNLLLNESTYLEKNGQRLALVGVENWGRGGFKKAGDLTKAAEQVGEEDFKILLSHDPSHWEDVVISDPYHYHLTLSGHTHGMQFGIEIPGWVKWSPIKWRYKYWAGIYKEAGQFINVNRGFGYLGYPGRVGMWPEVSVITLKKKANV